MFHCWDVAAVRGEAIAIGQFFGELKMWNYERSEVVQGICSDPLNGAGSRRLEKSGVQPC